MTLQNLAFSEWDRGHKTLLLKVLQKMMAEILETYSTQSYPDTEYLVAGSRVFNSFIPRDTPYFSNNSDLDIVILVDDKAYYEIISKHGEWKHKTNFTFEDIIINVRIKQKNKKFSRTFMRDGITWKTPRINLVTRQKVIPENCNLKEFIQKYLT